MGKIVKTSNDDSNKGRIKRKRRRSELEQLRRSALDAKQILKKKSAPQKVPKTTLTKTLKDFASKRDEIVNDKEIQSHNANKKGTSHNKIICKRLLPEIGLFQKGTKGKEIQRKEKIHPLDKTKQARLTDNFLELLKGDGETSNRFGQDLNKIVQECSENSEAEVTNKVSPVLVRANGETYKLLALRKQQAKLLKKPAPKKTSIQENNSHKSIQKDDQCKRRLFYDDDDNTNRQNINDLQNGEIRFSPRLFHNRHSSSPKEERDKKNKDARKENEVPKRQQKFLTTFEILLLEQFCAKMGEEYFTNVNLKEQSGDSLKEAVKSLKATYQETRQKEENRRQITEEFEVQACTAGSSISSFCNAVFPELRRSQRKSEEESEDSDFQHDQSSSRMITCYFPRDNGTPLVRGSLQNRKKFELPAKLFRSAGENTERSRSNTTSVEVNLNAESVRTRKIEEDKLEDHEDLISRYLRDCRIMKSCSDLRSVFEDMEIDNNCHQQHLQDSQMRQDEARNVKHVPSILRRNEKNRDRIMFNRNVQPVQNIHAEATETRWQHRLREDSQEVESQYFSRPSTSRGHNADEMNTKLRFIRVPRTILQRNPEGNPNDIKKVQSRFFRQKSYSIEPQCGSSIMSQTNKQMVKFMNTQTSSKGEVSCNDCSFRHNSLPLQNTEYNCIKIPPQSSKSHEKPTIVFLMPPPVHLHCNNVEQIQRPSFPDSRLHSRPLAITPFQSSVNQRNEPITLSSGSSSQPIKFVALGEDENLCRKPVYRHTEEGVVYRKGEKLADHEQRTLQDIFYEDDIRQCHQRKHDERQNNTMRIRSFRTVEADCSGRDIFLEDGCEERQGVRRSQFPENCIGKSRCCETHIFDNRDKRFGGGQS